MKLTPQHHRAIELFTTGMNNKGVADAVNVTPECVSRWMADFEFKGALNELLSSNQEATRERLRHLSIIALETIESLMIDIETPARDRLTAALKVIELSDVKVGRVGSSNAEVLAKEEENNKFFESLAI